MPRDASETRERLLQAAERLFAERGVHQATTREITAAAGQRNASALTYHFGSRVGALNEILERHNEPLDRARGALVREPLEACPTRALVAALLLPYADELATPSGRHYLRIVAQLSDRFAVWRREGPRAPNLWRILSALGERCDTDAATAEARLVSVIMLIATSLAERARQIDAGDEPTLSHDRFLAALADVITGGIEAPAGAPLVAPLVIGHDAGLAAS